MFYNFWIKRREARFRGVKVGDYVYLDERSFTRQEYNDFIDNYGPDPLLVVDTKTRSGTKYIIVQYKGDCDEFPLASMRKVDDDFTAERI